MVPLSDLKGLARQEVITNIGFLIMSGLIKQGPRITQGQFQTFPAKSMVLFVNVQCTPQRNGGDMSGNFNDEVK